MPNRDVEMVSMVCAVIIVGVLAAVVIVNVIIPLVRG